MTGQEIKKIRDTLGVSQSAFAQYLNVSFTTLNRWENDKASPDAPTIRQLEALRDLLNAKGVDKKKVLESLQLTGIASATTLAAAAGLIRLPAVAGFLGPLVGGVAGVIAALFLKDALKKKDK